MAAPSPTGAIPPEPGATGRPSRRLVSLDVFRGGDIALMLLVNYLGQDVFEPLAGRFPTHLFHAYRNPTIHDVTLADMVFPWFMLIIGVAMTFSMASGRGRGVGTGRRILLAARRSALLYVLGCLIRAALTAPAKPLTWHIAFTSNVLTEIALAYFVGVLVYQFPVRLRLGYVGLLLIGKWIVLRHVPVPGGVAGQSMIDYLHDHAGPAASLLTFAGRSVLVVIGTLAGDLLRSGPADARKAVRLVLIGVGLTILAWAWQLDYPFNPMFTSSTYALLAAGSGLVLLAGVYYAVDVRGWRFGWPLRVLGLNSIAIYFTVEMLWPLVLMTWQVRGPDGLGHSLIALGIEYLKGPLGITGAAWLQAMAYLLACWLGAWGLYRRGVFLKV